MFLLFFFFYIYIFLFLFKCFLYIVCDHFNFTHFLKIFMMALNDLTGASAGPVARIPDFIQYIFGCTEINRNDAN